MDRKQADSSGGGRLRGGRYSKKEKELMDMDISIAIVGGRVWVEVEDGIRILNGHRKLQ